MIYVIIPVHNRKHYTRECLRCLHEQVYKDIRVIVVDDGSTDGTTELIKEEFPEVTVLHGDGNLWWTKAINMGVSYAIKQSTDTSTDAILTLNDDLLIKPDYIEKLASFFMQNQPCLVGSPVVDVKNHNYLEYAGTTCNYYSAKWKSNAKIFHNNYDELKSKSSLLPSDDLSGRGTLIPMSFFCQQGLYDERNFPHYMADIELSVRARKSGYNLFVVTDSLVYNYMDATRNKRQSWDVFIKGFVSFKSPNYLRSRYIFAVRHTPLRQVFFLLDLSRMIFGFVKNKNETATL
ncbi:glycosyltransferase family 2 protein [Fibrella aestuarina]|uniref:glycosyltransferase family 2 protein n=1 Tax=Fibrella aestuarina TaxID=651143 RepID=UPI0009FE42D4|nr:glycosyltransferase family 2 protein [Fibrella aestuarina]